MKKILCLLMAMVLSLSVITPVMANNNITVKIDGRQIAFDVQPQLINNRTMVPLRAIFEALGATVDWNGDTQSVTSVKGGTTISLTINSPTMYVNGAPVTLDSPACLIDGRTLVPVRAISEAFGTTVDWNGTTSTVLISNPIVYSGHGDKVVTNVNIPSGSYYAELTHNGKRNFISRLYYGEKSYDYFSLANEIGNCSLQVALYENGNAAVNNGMLEVTADGDWTIAIKPVSGTTTTNVKGSGQVVTGLFTAKSSRAVVNLSHSGKRNFIAKIIKYNGTKSYDYESLSNEIGNYSGQKVVNLTAGAQYYFYVIADGSWSIDLGEGEAPTTYDSKGIVPTQSTTQATTQTTTPATDGDKVINVAMDKNSTVAKNVRTLKNAIINNGQRTTNGYGFAQSMGNAELGLVYLSKDNVCTFLMTSKTSDGTEVATVLYLREDEIPSASVSFGDKMIFAATYPQPEGTTNVIKSEIDSATCIELLKTSFNGFDIFLDMIAILHPDFKNIDMSDFGIEM